MNISSYVKLSIKAPNKLRKSEEDADNSVAEMLRTWDKVTCHYCGREISMLSGRLINNGQHFVCRKHQVN